MTTLINIAAVVSFFGCLVFLATYHLVAPWWRSQTGVNIVAFTLGGMCLLALRILAMVFGDGYWGQDFLRLLMIAMVGAAAWHRWYLLVVAQLGGARRADDAPPVA